MPTHEDIFLLHFILEEGLLSSKEIYNPLCLLYKQEASGKKNSLAKILEQMHLVSQHNLQELQKHIQSILEENRPQAAILPFVISLKDCKKEKILGKSSLGTTYYATHPQIGDCVYKCFEGIIAQNKKFLRHFLTQLKKTEQLDHPNWAKIYKVECYEGVLVREMIPGESLEDYISKGPIHFADATKIVYAVSQGLNAAYQLGSFHKNLKPANIILDPARDAVVVDGSLPPTIPNYLAPEQWQKKKSDQRADIYSLGIIYSHILSGIIPNLTPLEKEQSEHLFSKQLEQKEIPEKILGIIQKMTAYNPENRYQDYEELIADLQSVFENEAPEEMTEAQIEEAEMQNDIPASSDIEDAGEEASSEYHEGEEEEAEEEDGLMHTAMMATVSPSADVIKYRRAKRIAKEIVQEFWISFEDEIVQACIKDSFYEDLAPVIRTSRKRFQVKMAPASIENMPYLEEAWEALKNKVLQKIEAEKSSATKETVEEEKEIVEIEERVSEATVEAIAIDEKPRGFIPINEKEIREVEFEAQEASLAEPSESAFEEFASLDGQVSEASIEAVSAEEATEDANEDWDRSLAAVAVDEEHDSQSPPSLPEEKDFEISFNKKPSVKPAFPKNIVASQEQKSLSELAKEENFIAKPGVEEKSQETEKKTLPFPSIKKLKPLSAPIPKENDTHAEGDPENKQEDSSDTGNIGASDGNKEKSTMSGSFPGLKKDIKLKPYFLQNKNEED
ncbi:MAG: serine/threonine protein kinase [Candidatus Brocadiae bacterium]|nr:serine/threonine protein kinase [Candidatus Brocadiia bacterium]